ncbi:unnamed protein product [Mytilus coruscus]|uniref:Uncharacterized protein n=1 Tax=Mytilus coruscus TaxID=42192 RepID=A0A6J8A0I7_MYTCO|nr:unnamed protein product [Mytilus coruscus]
MRKCVLSATKIGFEICQMSASVPKHVKKYLQIIYNEGETSGRKATPKEIETEMRNLQDECGNKTTVNKKPEKTNSSFNVNQIIFHCTSSYNNSFINKSSNIRVSNHPARPKTSTLRPTTPPTTPVVTSFPLALSPISTISLSPVMPPASPPAKKPNIVTKMIPYTPKNPLNPNPHKSNVHDKESLVVKNSDSQTIGHVPATPVTLKSTLNEVLDISCSAIEIKCEIIGTPTLAFPPWVNNPNKPGAVIPCRYTIEIPGTMAPNVKDIMCKHLGYDLVNDIVKFHEVFTPPTSQSQYPDSPDWKSMTP